MVDHEMASKLAQTACFCCGVVNVETPGAEPFEPIPHLYYMDAVEGKDKLGTRDQAEHDRRYQQRDGHQGEDALLPREPAGLAAQASWDGRIRQHDEGVLDQKRGGQIGRPFGEGFRQHLGHAYPQDNILQKELGDLVHMM